MFAQCVAYTYEQARQICILYSNTAKGRKNKHGKKTGLKKDNLIYSLPELSFCAEKRRKRRCRREPNCDHVDCLRNASNHFEYL